MSKTPPPVRMLFTRAHWSPAQLAFFKDLHESTTPGVHKGMLVRLWKKKVCLIVRAMPQDTLLLDGIDTLRWGRGHGGAALDWLVTLADRHRLAVQLSVVPDESTRNPLADEKALRDWYAKRGFVTVRGSVMRREPR